MNSVGYFEIQADDIEDAQSFYKEVFGWVFNKDTNVPIEYFSIENAGLRGGLLKRPAPLPPPKSGINAYACSIQVSDFDQTALKILKNGGTIALEKFEIPGRCWQGYFLDSQGNCFGIFQVI